MLNAFDSGGDILGAAVLFLFGGWLMLVLRHAFALNARTVLGLYAWHSLWCAAYIAFTFQFGSDSTSYYEVSLNIYEPFRAGTMAVTYLTSFFSTTLGLSFGAVSGAFNIAGAVGLLAFASTMKALRPALAPWTRPLILLLLLLPGASFWSGSIGKDAFSFMAVGLAMWGSLRLPQRWLAMAIAVAALIFVRPHIAAVLLAAIGGAVIVAMRGQIFLRTFLFGITAIAGVLVFKFALAYVGLESASGAADFVEYVEGRQLSNIDGGSSFDLQSMSVPMRLFTYAYRPLLIDASDALGFALSFENLIIAGVSFAALGAFIFGRRSALPLLSWVMIVIYTAATWALLANTTANLGLAARQKWMFLPMLLLFCLSYLRPSARKKPGAA
jgi:hypothetical protein